MIFKRKVWLRGFKRYNGCRGVGQDNVLEMEVEFDLEPGCLNKPVLAVEIDGKLRHFQFAGETTVWHYDEVTIHDLRHRA